MKLYVYIFVLMLLSCAGFAGQTESATPYLVAESVYVLGAPAEISKPQKTSWKARLLIKTLTKKLATKQKRGDRPVHATNWLSFGTALGSWILAAAGTGLFLPLTIAAIVFGIIGINKSGTNKDYSGEGLAITGLSVGIFNILIVGLILVILLAAFG